MDDDLCDRFVDRSLGLALNTAIADSIQRFLVALEESHFFPVGLGELSHVIDEC